MKMSLNTTRRFIKQLIQHNTPKSIKDVSKAIQTANSKLLQRKSDVTTRKLEYELEIIECKRIIKCLNHI